MVRKADLKPAGHAKGQLQRLTRLNQSAPVTLKTEVESSGIAIPYLNVHGITIPVPRSTGSGKLAFRLESTLALSSIGTRNSQWERFTGWLVLQQPEDILDATAVPPKLNPHALLDFVFEELLNDARANDVVSTCKSRIEDLGLIPDTPLAVRNLLRVQQRAAYALRGLGDRKQAIPIHSLNSPPLHEGSIKTQLQLKIWATCGGRVSELKSCCHPFTDPNLIVTDFVKCVPDSQKVGVGAIYLPAELARQAANYKLRFGVNVIPLSYHDVQALLQLCSGVTTHSFRVGLATCLRVKSHQLGFSARTDFEQLHPKILAKIQRIFGWLTPDMFFHYSKNFMCYLGHSFLVHHTMVNWIFKSATPPTYLQDALRGIPFQPIRSIELDAHVYPVQGLGDRLDSYSYKVIN